MDRLESLLKYLSQLLAELFRTESGNYGGGYREFLEEEISRTRTKIYELQGDTNNKFDLNF